jgi:hypothetical protein
LDDRKGGICVQRAWRAFFLLLTMSTIASAGEVPKDRRPPPPPHSTDGPDLFGGFSYTHSGEANLKGWHMSASLPFKGSLRLVADLSGHYGSFAGADLSQITFLAGARYVWNRNRPLRPFGQALLGGARSKSSFVDASGTSFSDSHSAWGGALGGGADYRLSRRWAARGQAELLLLHSAGTWDSDPRLSLGLVYRFGR